MQALLADLAAPQPPVALEVETLKAWRLQELTAAYLGGGTGAAAAAWRQPASPDRAMLHSGQLDLYKHQGQHRAPSQPSVPCKHPCLDLSAGHAVYT